MNPIGVESRDMPENLTDNPEIAEAIRLLNKAGVPWVLFFGHSDGETTRMATNAPEASEAIAFVGQLLRNGMN